MLNLKHEDYWYVEYNSSITKEIYNNFISYLQNNGFISYNHYNIPFTYNGFKKGGFIRSICKSEINSHKFGEFCFDNNKQRIENNITEHIIDIKIGDNYEIY